MDDIVLNTMLNSSGWYVCNGAALDLVGSRNFDGSGRYLPNISDGRFLMGSTSPGVVGGANSANINHTHSINPPNTASSSTTLTTSQMPSHNHAQYVTNAVPGGSATRYDFRGDGASTAYSQGVNTGDAGGGQSHNHTLDIAAFTSDNSSVATVATMPKYLACKYIIRVV